MNIDPSTGLPELPEGQFFRVESCLSIFPYVRLMQRRTFGPFKWTEEIHAKWSLTDFDTEEVKIAWLAQRILEDVKRRGANEETAKRLSGDYPPRRLSGDPKNNSR